MGDLCSFRSVLYELSGSQAVDEQWHQDEGTWGYPGDAEEHIPKSSGSLSPDLEEMWRYGCPKSPDFDSDIEVGTEEEASEYAMRNWRHAIDGHFCESIRALLVADGNAHDSQVGRWVGLCAEHYSFLMKKESKYESEFPADKSVVKFDYGQPFGFDSLWHGPAPLSQM